MRLDYTEDIDFKDDFDHHDNSFDDANEFSGTVKALIFQSPETGFSVFSFEVGANRQITAIGDLPYLAPGEHLTAKGTWTTHPTYGKRFEVKDAYRRMPTASLEIFEYLASGTLPGIGPATARAIVEHFGANALDVIEENAQELSVLKGISKQKAHDIGQAFRKQTSVRRLISFLAKHALPAELSIKLYEIFGETALAALKNDPYVLADAELGARFLEADTLALSLGLAEDSPQRLMAAILHTLNHNLNNGHTFIPRGKLIDATAHLLDMPADLCEQALDTLIEQEKIMQDTLRGTSCCYLAKLHHAEVQVATMLKMKAQRIVEGNANIPKLLEDLEQETNIRYATRQKEAVLQAGNGQVLIITGAPGTGKTTSVRGILSLFDRMGLKTALAAPTGRAAKRMGDLTAREAQTIHRLLGAKFSKEQNALLFEHDARNPLEIDALIVDECSMIDILLAFSLLQALPEHCRLVMVGDADQLPSVGAGNFFSDMIRAKSLPTVRLNEIFRQASQSGIITAAHAINQGILPNLKEKSSDFFFLQRPNAARTTDTLVDLVTRRLPENMGIPSSEIQVLSPYKRGTCGTEDLNQKLQHALNPPAKDKPQKQIGNTVFRPGDKIMQTKNNYDILWSQELANGEIQSSSGIFNGDIGKVLSLDNRAGTLLADFDGRQVEYTGDELFDLELAYAMTVHKSQGSEYRAVVFVMEQGPPMLLNRTVLYTGVTRAAKLLILVGDEKVVTTMTENVKLVKRYSGLKLRLEE